MEYIAAMDFEVDNVIPVREAQVSNLFVKQKSFLSEADYDDFIDDVNREMTNASELTELGTLPLLIRRNSSKRSLNASSEGKENFDQASMALTRADTLILRTNTVLSEDNRDKSKSRHNSVSMNDKPAKDTLQSFVLSPGCSLERSLTAVIPVEVNNSVEKISFGISSLIERHVSSQEKENLTQREEIEVDGNLDHSKGNHHGTLSQDLLDCQASLENTDENDDLLPVSSNRYFQENTSSKILEVTEPEPLSAAITTPEENYLSSSSPLFHITAIDQVEETVNTSMTGKKSLEAAQDQVVAHTTQSAGENTFLDNSIVDEDASKGNVSLLEDLNYIIMEISSPSPRSEDALPDTQTLSVSHKSITKKRSRSPSPTKSDNPRKIHKSTAQDNSDLNRRSEQPDEFNDTSAIKLKEDSALNIIEPMTNHDPAHYQISSFLAETPQKKLNMKDQSRRSSSIVQNTKRSSVIIRRSSVITRRSSVITRRSSVITRRSSVITRRSVSRLTSRHPNRSAPHIFRNKVKIFKAVEEGNLEFVRDLMSDTGPAIRIGQKDSTLLHIAASSNQSDLLIYLLKYINPNIINKDGQTSAHMAAVKGHTQILKILMTDKDFNPNKQDKMGRTFKDLLLGPLFEAILDGDKNKTRILIQLGADPDCHAGKNVEGILSRELNVTSARHLSQTLHGDDFLKKFAMNNTDSSTYRQATETETHLHLPKFFCGKQSSTKAGTPVQNTRGYACILNFKSFIGKPELERETSDLDCRKLAKVLEGMGFFGHLHTSLTAEQVKTTLRSDDTKRMLDNAKCAIFVISSHSINKNSFLTTDMQLLTTDWVLNIFKDSECPQLKSKPKLFIFDFNSGFYIKKMNFNQEPQPIRMEEPLHNMLCIASESNSFLNSPSQNQFFMRALCRTLGECSQLTILDMYRELLKEYSNEHSVSFPELRNFDFPENAFLCSKL